MVNYENELCLSVVMMVERHLLQSCPDQLQFTQINYFQITLCQISTDQLFKVHIVLPETSQHNHWTFSSANTDSVWQFTKGWGNNQKSEMVVSVSRLHYSHLCTLIGFPFAGCILPPTHSTHQRQPAQIGTVTTITAALCFPF